ncbi:LLM class flavin-dependent oxidoreductase [Bosea sp. (in: a-proteobacteria)]|uniref:LLM class flavin-dependent oxidoreductase n=1 Tax=Bosea sp. (in: a-proteobacteria) TaxID=1871050 RepID=UPI002FCB5129
MLPLSVLDLAFVTEGATPADALHNSRALARHAEKLGYTRFWLAEHHNMTGIASAATSVAIGYVAEGTATIRVGAGGIMLPNHSPLVIAEQFGTLEALYPGRIDLGLGRAPGTDQRTWRALRREADSAERFPQDVLELQALLGPLQPDQVIQAVPGTGSNVPLWILGSSLFGSQLAAMLGLPYAFASHFSPDALMDALAVYRERFQPSAQLARPHAMVGVNVVAAETDAEAQRLFTSVQQRFADMLRGRRGLLPKPIDDIESYWSGPEKAQAQRMLACSFVGSRATVQEQLQAFIEKTQADELIVASAIYDHAARLRSYEILAELQPALGRTHAPTETAGAL